MDGSSREQRLGGLTTPSPRRGALCSLAPLIQALPPGSTTTDVSQEPHMLSRHLGKVFQLKVVTQ